MKITKGYTFDDVLLVPKYSEIVSRKEVDVSVDLGKNVKLKMPIVSANMKSVTEVDMAKKMVMFGGLGLLHRFCDIETQLNFFIDAAVRYVGNSDSFQNVGCSIGIKKEDRLNVDKMVAVGCKIICIDIAHGDHYECNEMVSWIANKHPEVLIIAGNVATRAGALRLYNSGANVIKVGIGGGSLCTTRIETGNGVPQLTALEDVYNASFPDIDYVSERNLMVDEMRGICQGCLDNAGEVTRKFKIIADGGIRRAGDIVKALCFSDAVMLGNLLAGTDETPGQIVIKSKTEFNVTKNIKYKEYAGSSTHKTNHIEGVVAQMPHKGPVGPIIEKLLEGLKSGCSYQGAADLTELKQQPEFIQITNAGLKESHPHAWNQNE